MGALELTVSIPSDARGELGCASIGVFGVLGDGQAQVVEGCGRLWANQDLGRAWGSVHSEGQAVRCGRIL